MQPFTVTITLKDKPDLEDGVDINARIDPMPTEEEMQESPAIQMLNDFLESLQGGGEVLSAEMNVRKDGETIYHHNIINP